MIRLTLSGAIVFGVALLLSLACGVVIGVCGSQLWSESQVAECHRLRAEAYAATLEAGAALDECVCAVSGRCRR